MKQELKEQEQKQKEARINTTIAEPESFKGSIKAISGLANEIILKVEGDRFKVCIMDPSNVAMVVWDFLSSGCTSWDCSQGSIGLNVSVLYNVLKNLKKTDILQLNKVEGYNNLDIVFKGASIRKYSIPLISLDDMKEQKEPSLKFDADIIINSKLLHEQIKEVRGTSESVIFNADSSFNIEGAGELSQVVIENKPDHNTIISGKAICKYSIEYLLKMVAAWKLSDAARIQYSQDYPLSITYNYEGVQTLKFILAPRVGSD